MRIFAFVIGGAIGVWLALWAIFVVIAASVARPEIGIAAITAIGVIAGLCMAIAE